MEVVIFSIILFRKSDLGAWDLGVGEHNRIHFLFKKTLQVKKNEVNSIS